MQGDSKYHLMQGMVEHSAQHGIGYDRAFFLTFDISDVGCRPPLRATRQEYMSYEIRIKEGGRAHMKLEQKQV